MDHRSSVQRVKDFFLETSLRSVAMGLMMDFTGTLSASERLALYQQVVSYMTDSQAPAPGLFKQFKGLLRQQAVVNFLGHCAFSFPPTRLQQSNFSEEDEKKNKAALLLMRSDAQRQLRAIVKGQYERFGYLAWLTAESVLWGHGQATFPLHSGLLFGAQH